MSENRDYIVLNAVIIVIFLQSAPIADSRPSDQGSRANQWAADTAMVAGGATYCAFDDEVVENYIAAAQAKIAAEANDEVEVVVARIEFSHKYNAASSREPLGGCENFATLFVHEAAKLN